MAHIQICRGEEGRIRVLLPYDPEFIELLGHKSSKTTEIYTHVSERNIAAIRSPLDKTIAARRAEGEEADRVELANLSSDNPRLGSDSRIKVQR